MDWFRKRARPTPQPTVNEQALDRSIDCFRRVLRTASDSTIRRRAASKLLLARYLKARFGDLPEPRRLDLYARGKNGVGSWYVDTPNRFRFSTPRWLTWVAGRNGPGS